MDSIPDILAKALSGELPGTDVQWEMASSDRMTTSYPRIPRDDARQASVLILLYPEDGELHTVFMQRPDYDGVHSGQISFPGGKKEPSDIDLIQTALRETQEETGADIDNIRILGTLTPLFIWVSNMLVTPVVGWTEVKPPLNFTSEEVVFLFEASVKKLLDPSIVREKPYNIKGEKLNVRFFDYNGHVIWGATAMMLNELLTIIKKEGVIKD
jgi:8-oxo-dGTP pyrophosphatase MutT (NUDIX family)